MKKIIYLIILPIFFFFSCKENKKVKADLNNLTEVKNEIQNEPITELSPEETFLEAIQKQPVESLPFSFASFLLDSLHNESQYDELVFNLAYKDIDTSSILNNLNQHLNYNLTIQDIHNDTESFYSNYYSMLISDCILSPSYLYKRFPSLNSNTEVLLTSSKLIQEDDRYIRGLVFEIIIYDIKSDEIMNRQRIFTGGIAKYDNRYFESFIIDKDFNIKIKSYTGYEIESNIVARELKMMPDGSIIEATEPIVIVESSEEDYD